MTRFSTVSLTLAMVATVVAMVGCRQRGRVYDEIRRRDERFAMEDRTFDLQNRIETLQSQLASCRAALSARSGDVKKAADDAPGEFSPPKVEGLQEELTTPPVVDDGTEFDPGEAAEPLPEPSAGGNATSKEGPMFGGAEFDGSPTGSAGAATIPTKVVINRLLTGGYDADRLAGHEGVLVVFEPRDEMDRLVDLEGQVDIAVVNPSLGFGPEADVARWHFSVAEAAKYKKTTPLGRGYQFELPWPVPIATGGTFRVYVRLIAPDQQTFTARHKIQVVAPGPAPATTWSPASETARRWTTGERQQNVAVTRRPDWTQAENQPPIRIVERPVPVRNRRVADDSDHEARPAVAKKQPRKPARPRWSPYR